MSVYGRETHARSLANTYTYSHARESSLQSEREREREGYYPSLYTHFVCVSVYQSGINSMSAPMSILVIWLLQKKFYSYNLVTTKAVINIRPQHEEGEEAVERVRGWAKVFRRD